MRIGLGLYFTGLFLHGRSRMQDGSSYTQSPVSKNLGVL